MMETILCVDDEAANLNLLKQNLSSDYRLLFAKDGEAAIGMADKNVPDLILLDVMMPGLDGFQVCEKLKNAPATQHIPVMFVTAMNDIADEMQGFVAGGVDYITKPISGPIVRARVKTQITLSKLQSKLSDHVRTTSKQYSSLLKTAIEMLGEAGHYNDTDTGLHIWRMAAYARVLAEARGWTEEDSMLLELAAPMHDTGKIAIPDAILKKSAKLDGAEWEIMKTHAEVGAKLLSKSKTPLFMLAAEIAEYHHEKWDGSGYPHGVSGDAIPESARIVAIADVYDALTMRRPYKDPWPIDEAVAAIREGAGQHFDPDLVQLFVENLDRIEEVRVLWQTREEELAKAEAAA